MCLSILFILQTERIPDIYKMPPPIKQDPDDHTDYRIPHPVPQPKTYFFISVRSYTEPQTITHFSLYMAPTLYPN